MNFEYNEITLPDDAIFKISPSSISKFFDYPVVWYKEHITKEEAFQGSTATVLGTVIHALAEEFGRHGKTPPNAREECNKFIDEQSKIIEDLDTDLIKELYPDMAKELINQYLRHNMPTEVESEVYFEVENGIYAGGTTDNRTGSIIVDYKNVSSKPKTDSIPFGYLIQMLTYARGYILRGIPIDRIRLVYTVRPTKTLGVRVFEVTHQIRQEDWDMLDNTLQLISDTVQLHNEYPELDYIMFKSMQLKQA